MIDHTIHAFDADLSELAGRIEEMGRLDERQICLLFQSPPAIQSAQSRPAESVGAGHRHRTARI
jgi:hypothetical protein